MTKDFDFPESFGFQKYSKGGSASPKKMSRGGMRNIRDEEARVIGVQDDAADELKRVRSRKSNDSQERRDKSQQMRRVSSRERNARDEMTRLRGEAEKEVKKGFYAKGGSKKDWIQGAVKKPGALRGYMDVAKGETIPKGALNKVASGQPAKAGGPKPSAKTQQRARLAKTFSKMK